MCCAMPAPARGTATRTTSVSIFDVAEGRGEIIDDEREVGGYPIAEPTRAPFVEADWDLATMEPRSGRYPGQRDDFIQQPTTARDAEMRR